MRWSRSGFHRWLSSISAITNGAIDNVARNVQTRLHFLFSNWMDLNLNQRRPWWVGFRATKLLWQTRDRRSGENGQEAARRPRFVRQVTETVTLGRRRGRRSRAVRPRCRGFHISRVRPDRQPSECLPIRQVDERLQHAPLSSSAPHPISSLVSALETNLLAASLVLNLKFNRRALSDHFNFWKFYFWEFLSTETASQLWARIRHRPFVFWKPFHVARKQK